MRALAPLVALSLAACGQPELNPDAYHWDVRVTGFSDDCNAQPQGYAESFTYSLSFDGSNTDIAIGWDTFAAGRISGCGLTYQTPIIGEDRADGVFVQWQLTGEAAYRQGGDTCDMASRVTDVYAAWPGLDFDTDWEQRSGGLEVDAVDWIGVETFQIVNVLDAAGEPSDALPVGCEYDTLVVGTYRGRE